MNELTFHVPGMTCGHCESAVKAEVGKLSGVEHVAVDLTAKIVTVGVGASGPGRDAIVAAIDEAGFEVTS